MKGKTRQAGRNELVNACENMNNFNSTMQKDFGLSSNIFNTSGLYAMSDSPPPQECRCGVEGRKEKTKKKARE